MIEIFLTFPAKTIFRSTDRLYIYHSFAKLADNYPIKFVSNDTLYPLLDFNLRYILNRFGSWCPYLNKEKLQKEFLHIKIPKQIASNIIFSYGGFPCDVDNIPVIWEQTFAPTKLNIDIKQWRKELFNERIALVKKAKAIITASDISVKWFRTIFPEYSSKIFKIPYYLPYLEPLSEQDICRKFEKVKRLKMVFIGKQGNRKGLDTLLKAYVQLKEVDKKQIDLTVISSFADGRIAIPEGVTYYNFVESVTDILKKAHVLLFPTKREAFGLVLIEAMAMGCSILTTKAPIQKDIVGNSGFFVNPYDTKEIKDGFTWFLKEKDKLLNMALTGNRKFVNEFYHLKVGKDYYNLFKKVLSDEM